MTEAGLAIARKVVLCAGLPMSALLFLYPHWRGSFVLPTRVFEYGLGRGFITAPPIPNPGQLVQLVGMGSNGDETFPILLLDIIEASYRVHRVSQFTEVALALLFTFGLMRALKKPAGD